MIRVTMELLPGGLDLGEENEHLGTIMIDNDLLVSVSTGGTRGTYRARIWKKRKNRVVAAVKVADYPRLAYHPWELVRRVLNEAHRLREL